eukprot:s4869_g12.t1
MRTARAGTSTGDWKEGSVSTLRRQKAWRSTISRLWLQCPLQQRHWPTRRTRLLQGVRWWSPGRPSRPQPRWNFPDWTRGLFVQLWRQVSEQDALLGAIHRAVLSLEVGAPAYLGGRSLQSRPLPGRDPAVHDDYDVEPGGHFPSWKPYGWMCGKLRDKSSFPLKPSKRTESRCLRDRLLILSVVMATRGEKLQLFRLLASSGRLGLLLPDEITADITSGMFAVTKDLSRDRLILDGRGANVYEIPLNAWTKQLASAEKVAGIYVPEDSILLASGRDLKDFFYQFVVTRERTIRSGALDRDELRYVFGNVARKAYVGLSTMAMGDCSACEYAQCSHLSVLRGHDVFTESQLNTLTGAVPRGLLHIGVIVGDLISLERINRRAGLITNPSKAFQNQLKAKSWGVELDGVRGVARPSSTRLWPLIAVTARVIVLGLATVGLLKGICGSWTSVLLLRRRLLSVMNLIFAAAAGPDPEVVIRLSPELKSELWCLVGLGAFAGVDLRAKPASFTTATGASSWGGSAVRAEVPCTSLLESVGPDRGASRPGAFCANELANFLAGSLQYKEQWRKQFKQAEHVNCKELRAYCTRNVAKGEFENFENFDLWLASLPSFTTGPDFSHLGDARSADDAGVPIAVDCESEGQRRRTAKKGWNWVREGTSTSECKGADVVGGPSYEIFAAAWPG